MSYLRQRWTSKYSPVFLCMAANMDKYKLPCRSMSIFICGLMECFMRYISYMNVVTTLRPEQMAVVVQMVFTNSCSCKKKLMVLISILIKRNLRGLIDNKLEIVPMQCIGTVQALMSQSIWVSLGLRELMKVSRGHVIIVTQVSWIYIHVYDYMQLTGDANMDMQYLMPMKRQW